MLGPKEKTEVEETCSFCGKAADDARRLVKGYDACICDECTELCVMSFEEERKSIGNVKRGCICLGPSSAEFENVFRELIEPVFRSAGAGVTVFSGGQGNSRAEEDSWKRFYEAGLRIIDVTGQEPLPMFGLGLACGRLLLTFVLAQDKGDLPLAAIPEHMRCFLYEDTDEGRRELARTLEPYATWFMRHE